MIRIGVYNLIKCTSMEVVIADVYRKLDSYRKI